MRALALLIGNAKYPKPHDLNNASNDARDYAAALSKLGFVVRPVLDATIEEMDEAVTEFGNDLNNFDVGLFFYAGHGFQEAGENYLTAINTTFTTMGAKRTSLDLRQILGYMERADNPTNIIILDACRDELEHLGKRRGLATDSLAPVFAPKGTIIAYSTSPGQRSSDGLKSDGNGVYTRALLAHIETQGLSIEEYFKRVRNSVSSFTEESQVTWEHTSLTANFVFNSGVFTHASAEKYAAFAIADSKYTGAGDPVLSGIIDDLKSHNFYTQSPAIKRISQIDGIKADADLLFLIGRNIIQTALGGEHDANRFMNNLCNRLLPFQRKDGNPVFEGMLFEIYFNGEGLLRENPKATSFLENVMALKDDKRFKKSFEFITEQLKPFEDKLFFMPAIDETGKSIDVVFEEKHYKAGWSDDDNEIETVYLVKSISFEGKVIMKDEHEPGARYTHREDLTFHRFKLKAAELLGIPLNKLVIHSNIKLSEDAPVQFQWNVKFRRA